MKDWKRMAAGIAMLAGAATAAAQDFGDTPYVQTPQVVVDAMLETAAVTKNDYVIDLGSGDGRMVITAAKKIGARGFGVDLDKRLVTLANNNAKKAGVADRAKFYARDLFETDLSPATVIATPIPISPSSSGPSCRSSNRYTPSGMAAMPARMRRSA